MRSIGIRRLLAGLATFCVEALTMRTPRTPAVVKFNEHPFAKRSYGKIVEGGHGLLDSIAGVFRTAIGLVATFLGLLRPAAAVAALLAVTLALDAAFSPDALLAEVGVVAFASKNLREAKRRLVAESRSKIETAEKAEAALDESSASPEAIAAARANTAAAKADARALLEQAKDLDPDIALAEAQEEQEAALGRSQGRLAGGRDADPAAADHGNPPASSQADEFAGMTVEQRSLVVGRVVRAMAAGKGDLARARAHAERHWGDDDVAFRALSATDEVAGGVVLPDSVASAVIEFLRPMSAVRRLNPTVIPMGSGTLRLPKLAGGAVAGYIGENDNIPKTEQTFGQLKMTFRKLAALVPVSNDLLRNETVGVDGLVRDDVGSALVQTSDGKFIRGLGTEHSPKGLRYWAPDANVIAANGTVTLANVTTDLGRLVLALENANVRMLRPGWLFSPRTKFYLMTVRDGNGNYAFRDEMLRGFFWGWPFASTTQIPQNLGGGGDESEVILADFADAVIGEALNLMIDASTEASYHDGTTLQSAFSRDQTVVRALQEHDFGMRHDESVAVLSAVTWGA